MHNNVFRWKYSTKCIIALYYFILYTIRYKNYLKDSNNYIMLALHTLTNTYKNAGKNNINIRIIYLRIMRYSSTTQTFFYNEHYVENFCGNKELTKKFNLIFFSLSLIYFCPIKCTYNYCNLGVLMWSIKKGPNNFLINYKENTIYSITWNVIHSWKTQLQKVYTFYA